MTITRRNLIKSTGAAGVAVIGASVLPKAARANEFTLRLHQFLPAQANVPAHVLDPWADAIEEQSGGRITVERYPSMQLGGTPPDLIDRLRRRWLFCLAAFLASASFGTAWSVVPTLGEGAAGSLDQALVREVLDGELKSQTEAPGFDQAH